MPTEDELLASVMKKVISSREDPFGCYIDIHSTSMCIDGWVEGLTPEEYEALNRVYKETAEG